jgi:limonene-1,2-epoxide hydrolase
MLALSKSACKTNSAGNILCSRYDARMTSQANTQNVIAALLSAIESRDLRAIRNALHPNATWQNVPHAPVHGRESVMALLAGIVCWSDKVRWDVVSVVTQGSAGWLERLDRFWLAGEEYSVACNGIFTIDPETQTVLAVRDYVDLGEWRSRVGSVLADFSGRSPATVVQRHGAAVERLDPVAMAADYALDAVLERPGASYEGWYAIADYFDSVPSRLAGGELTFGSMAAMGSDKVRLSWRITKGKDVVVSGADTFQIVAGRITHQVTTLSEGDF